MGCACPSPPPAPDFAGAAKEQGAANLEVAKLQSLTNNPNQVTPYGSSTYTMGPDGRPIRTDTLSPAEQAKLEAANRVQQGSLNILEEDMPNIRNALVQPFGMPGGSLQGGYAPGTGPTDTVQTRLDYSGAPAMPTASDATRRAVTDAMYSEGARFLDPQFAQKRSSLDAMLANQGIVRNPGEAGSAWGQEQANLGREEMGAYGDLRDRSVQSGIGAMQSLYDMAMRGRQQGVNELTTKGTFRNAANVQQNQTAQALAQLIGNQRGQGFQEYTANRTMPINMLTALLSGSQVNNPTFQPTTPTSITPPPIFQGAVEQGKANAADASSQQAGLGNWLGLAGKIAPLIPWSDRRLKTDIKNIGTRYGLPWYSYNLGGRAEEGVMADEAEKLYPEAVTVGPLGFKQVDYAMLGA